MLSRANKIPRPYFFDSYLKWFEYYVVTCDDKSAYQIMEKHKQNLTRYREILRVICEYQVSELLVFFDCSLVPLDDSVVTMSVVHNFLPLLVKLIDHYGHKELKPYYANAAFVANKLNYVHILDYILDETTVDTTLLLNLHFQSENLLLLTRLLYNHKFFEKFFKEHRGRKAVKKEFDMSKHPCITTNRKQLDFISYAIASYHDSPHLLKTKKDIKTILKKNLNL